MRQTEAVVTVEGTDEERQLVEQVVNVARFQGRLFADTAPIYLKRDELVDFLARRPGGRDRADLAAALDAALTKNPAIFARTETADDVVTYVTTRRGVAPVEQDEDTVHTLPERFVNPADVLPLLPSKPQPRVAPAWAHPSFLDELDELVPEEEEAEAAATPNGTAAVVEAEPRAEAEAVPVTTPAATAPPPERPALDAVPVEQLRAALAARLENDDRFVSFGDRYFPEDLVDRYSRGDIRRIRDYIQEVTEPLSDDQLLQDLFGRRPNDPAYEGARFSIDYRMSREKRDFEFVGTRDTRLWTTPNLPPIGTTLRKASELGQDYRYLLDEPAASGVEQAVTHVLTFFEWFYGLLPLDGQFRQLFPGPYLEDQKSAVLRFDAPQLFVSFLAELRFPTGSRGGYLVGFDEFYRENLVPGARLTVERMPGNDGQYQLQFAPAQREERLLQLDERRNRYVFRQQPILCAVDEAWLLSERRYPRLANVKPLDDRERRRADAVVAAAFERVGENVGTKDAPRYWSAPEELLPVVNLERPFSSRALRDILDSPQYPQFSADPESEGACFYEPAVAPARKNAASRGATELEETDEEAG